MKRGGKKVSVYVLFFLNVMMILAVINADDRCVEWVCVEILVHFAHHGVAGMTLWEMRIVKQCLARKVPHAVRGAGLTSFIKLRP